MANQPMFYQEITILTDPEISPYFIWSKLYTQLHIALADLHNKQGIDSIGVSFPNYKFEKKGEKTFATLGDKLRIFSPTDADLKALNIDQWLERLTDYLHIKSIKPVPNDTGYVTVRRYRGKSLERKAKDYAKYKGISFEDAMAFCLANRTASDNIYPFIQLTSQDNGHEYRLSILQEPAEQPMIGSLNTYGINNTSHHVTVPQW
jgi:CRISPR-associated endonuclease Csy4